MSYKRSRGYAVFLIPGVLAFLLIVIVPFAANIGISFTKWKGVGTPEWIGFDNYEKAFHDELFWASFQNNMQLLIAMTVIPTILGLLLAVFLYDNITHHFGQRATSVFRAGFYLPQIMPLVVAAIVWRWIYQPNWGILNWLLDAVGLEQYQRNWLGDGDLALKSIMGMMVWFQLGYPLVIFMAALQRVDPQLYEAASIDGASWIQKVTRITVPLIRPEIYVVILTTAIHAMKVFAPIYVMSRGTRRATIVAARFSYKNFFEVPQVGYGATIATLLTSIIILLTAVFMFIQTRQERRENQ
ncbi:MAG TPA: sugar ABC transporter permease [Aggregatilineaceae bacterium]|nr:sugar ABC transporter permease [Aggregatilineaceae bacterium]